MKVLRLVTTLLLLGPFGAATVAAQLSLAKSAIFVRTERFPRPPYSGATYYIYERDGQVICTKLEVCNKYDDCSTRYVPGAYKDEQDIRTGEPSGKTDAVVISRDKIKKHVCLTRHHLD